MLKMFFHSALQILAIFFLCVACWLVLKEIRTVGWDEIQRQITTLSSSVLFLSLLFVVADYLAFSGYDFLALKYIQKHIAAPYVIKTAFISFAITNTTGHAYLAGGSVRYFLYARFGLTQFDVLKMIAFESLTYLLGISVVLDLCLFVIHYAYANAVMHNVSYLIVLAVLMSLISCIYLFLPPKKWKKAFTLPSVQLKITQLIIGVADCLAATLVFYTLFRGHLSGDYFYVACVFLMAQIIGIISQVPGGLGVFEATFLSLFPHSVDQKGPLLATLISFRVLYYFLPLLCSCLLLMLEFLSKRIKRQK